MKRTINKRAQTAERKEARTRKHLEAARVRITELQHALVMHRQMLLAAALVYGDGKIMVAMNEMDRELEGSIDVDAATLTVHCTNPPLWRRFRGWFGWVRLRWWLR